MEKNEESPSKDKQKEEEEVESVLLARCVPATESPSQTIVKEMENTQTGVQSDSDYEACG